MKRVSAAGAALVSMIVFPASGLALLLGMLSLAHYGLLVLTSLCVFAASLTLAFRAEGTTVRRPTTKRSAARTRSALLLHLLVY